ncbi:MAG: phage Gp37/Gp68 family protein [Cephaloticoccus sp.]|nr:phage Gp37/Gp68 family protein [Cephaloticoccus sp.]
MRKYTIFDNSFDMGKNSHIEWTHHTFNPWWGCEKVSPACLHCYAESWAKRVGSDVWGKSSPRRFFTNEHWKEPHRWNAEAEKAGERRRVFCASMADVFEARTDLDKSRVRLWELIEATPSLDWLLLTKRPQHVTKMAPWGKDWPINIWLGTTVENQVWANKRLPHLLRTGAKIKFLSCEPLLGPLDLSDYVGNSSGSEINWVIAGGESGPNSRPMNPKWLRTLRDFCRNKRIAFHFKQWGHWVPRELLTQDQKKVIMVGDVEMAAAGKKLAGRFLDGRTWDEFPISA